MTEFQEHLSGIHDAAGDGFVPPSMSMLSLSSVVYSILGPDPIVVDKPANFRLAAARTEHLWTMRGATKKQVCFTSPDPTLVSTSFRAD